MSNLLILGTYITSAGFDETPKIDKGLFIIKDGVIEDILNPEWEEAKKVIKECKVQKLGDDEILIPGFADTHCHAPQFPFCGITPVDKLLDWLEKYTFPTESRFHDEKYAEDVYTELVTTLLSNGTTTACFFASAHPAASMILAETCVRLGLRALIGLVSMDREAPQDYADPNARVALQKAEAFVKAVKSMEKSDLRLIQPILTPRFIPSCTLELLKGLAGIAKKHDCRIQSHISETYDEVAFSKELEPDFECDTEVFDWCGLLTPKTIMAHGNHLSDKDLTTLRKRGTALSHNPWSNFLLSGKPLSVRRCLDHGVQVGLGSDMAAGVTVNLMVSARLGVMASRAFTEKEHLHWTHFFHLATKGGADSLGTNSGELEVGKEFDALVLSLRHPNIPVFRHKSAGSYSILERFERVWHLGDDRNVRRVYVQGREVINKGKFLIGTEYGINST